RPYMFTASLPPSIIATVSAALSRIQQDGSLGARVRANGQRLYRGLEKAGFALGPQPNPVVAVKMPDRDAAVAFWKQLLAEGIYLNLALPPATPGSLALLRSSVNAMHTDEQIDCAIAAICRVGVRLGIITSAQVTKPATMAEKLALPAE
ncbi:MAG: aminotransferase class I/II-fold pyridoxal phosphate-dependent enzyme, partial [Alphaproteobacteria bacterium]